MSSGLPSFSTVRNALQSTQLYTYKKPAYLQSAARRKFGRNIHVIGSTEAEIADFWRQVRYKAVQFEGEERPKQKSKSVIDIDVKTHCNYGEEVDLMKITTKKSSSQTRSKTYQLSLGKEWKFQAGANMDIDAKFFNIAGAGIGGSSSLSRTKTEGETASDTYEEALGQEFGIEEQLKVLPKTKMTATITTLVVTYEAWTRVEVRVDREATIPVRFRSRFQQILGGICSSLGVITAEDIFRENGYEVHRDINSVWFVMDMSFSYLGEEVEVGIERKEL